MNLPTPDPTRFEQREALIGCLRTHLCPDQLIHRREDVIAYECDGLSAYRQRPMLVALPVACVGRRSSCYPHGASGHRGWMRRGAKYNKDTPK